MPTMPPCAPTACRCWPACAPRCTGLRISPRLKAEVKADMKTLLGGKGANLAEMSNLGLPVPPGLTVTTEVCTYYYANAETYPTDLKEQVDAAVAQIGRRAA